MPLPPKRHSNSRRKKRRSHDRLKSPTLIVCSQCGEKKPPHHACPHCGFYKDRAVLRVVEES